MTAESGGKNVYNYKYNTDPNYYTASGYYQFTNTTWRQGAAWAGVDTSQYPTAISAPYDVQTQVANSVLDHVGMQPWSGSKANTYLNQIDSGQNVNLITSPVDGGSGVSGTGYSTALTGTPHVTVEDPTTGQPVTTSGSGSGTSGTGTTTTTSDPTGTGSTGLLGKGSGYTPPAQTGGPSTVGLSPGTTSIIGNWITGAENAVGGAFKQAFTYVFSGIADWFLRGGLVLVGVILVALALWRLMDPDMSKTKAMMADVVPAA